MQGSHSWATRKENTTNKIIYRKNLRLKYYDYSNNGYYFITICTKDRKHFLGDISTTKLFWNNKSGKTETVLSKEGIIVQKNIICLNEKIDGIIVDDYVIMPNHIHLIVQLGRVAQECDPYGA